METIKKVAAHVIMAVLCIPVLAIFNEGESILPNLFGIAYAALLFGAGARFAPKFIKDIFGGR